MTEAKNNKEYCADETGIIIMTMDLAANSGVSKMVIR